MRGKQWWILPILLVAALLAMYLLALGAEAARRNEHPDTPAGRIAADYDQALVWGGRILGFATTLAGFLGIAAGASAVARRQDPEVGATGLAGVLAGATILGLGGWAAPAALATLVVGGSAVKVMRVVKQSP